MSYYTIILIYSVIFVYSLYLNIFLGLFLHFFPTLFFIFMSFKKKDFCDFLYLFGFLLLIAPFINWILFIAFLTTPKSDSKIYNKKNQDKLFKKYEQNILAKFNMKRKKTS